MKFLLNPVLKRELLTSLRKINSFAILFFFISSLSLLIMILWPQHITSSEATQISREMFQYFVGGQLFLIAIMIPSFAAGTMTMEKEKACLDVLITSPITPFAILIGKYLSSILVFFIMLICSLPVVSVCFLVGGVGTLEVISGYLLLISSALTFGMIGLTTSTFFYRTHTSLSISYLIEIFFVVPLFLMVVSSQTPVHLAVAIPYTLFCFFLSFFLFTMCWRRMYSPFATVPKSVEEENIEEQVGLILDRTQFPDNLISPPKKEGLMNDGENPVRIKEITTEIFGQGTLMIRLIIQISVLLTVVFMFLVYNDKEQWFVVYLLAFSALIAPAFACNTFTQEKERQTLDLLVVTLLTPQQIISGKLVAGLRIASVLTGFLAIFLVLGWLLNALNANTTASFPLSRLLSYLAVVQVSIIFCTTLALFHSLFQKTTMRSMIFTYGTILAIYLGPILHYAVLDSIRYIQAEEYRWIFLLSPVGMVQLIKNPGELLMTFSIAPIILHLTGYLIISIVFVLLMQHFFYRWTLE